MSIEQKKRPSVLVLMDKEMPAFEIAKFDVVICSHGFLRSRFRDFYTARRHFHSARLYGIQRTSYAFGVLRERPYAPLHSEFYNEHGLQFSVIIVDESHLAKRETTLLNRAIRSLEYGVAFLITGTPVFKTWRDLAGQLMLLPGEGDGGRGTSKTWTI
jgi:hypothetical protein